MNDPRSQTIALAGTAQSALWVQELAQGGVYRLDRIDSAIDAVLCTEPETADAVYGGLAGIRDGLSVLHAQLGKETGRFNTVDLGAVTRYMGQILRLAGKVQKNTALSDALREGLEQAQQARRMGVESEATRARLADLYTRTVSTVAPRVMVQGNPANLQNTGFVETIRLFLLFGIRSGVLWRQCGGRMWRLVLQRSHILNQAQKLSRPG